MFRALFGSRAGWAHSVLFAAELPSFRQLLPADMQNEMKQFAVDQKSSKKSAKEEKEKNKDKRKGEKKISI